MYKSNNIKTEFSRAEINITKFFASQINGRNNPAVSAGKNLDKIPGIVGSNDPISKEFPW
jgi:hypothetical protein